MTPEAEGRVRAAVEALAVALLDAVRAEAAQVQAGPDRLLSIPEAAERLGIGRSAVYELIGRGCLHSVKIGRRRLVPASAIAEFTEADRARS